MTQILTLSTILIVGIFVLAVLERIDDHLETIITILLKEYDEP